MSGPTVQDAPPGTEADRYSLSEIDALCRKAARGAGCPWGLAEEAGKAARWLAARALPGPEALAALLDGPRDCPCAGEADAPGCALRVGSALGDRAERIAAGEGVSLEVAQPLLVLAQVGRAATATGATFALEWPGVRVSCGPEGFALEGDGALVSGAATLRCTPAARAEASVTPADCRSRAVAREVWARLERFAARTCAPATEASRRSGAGTGGVVDD